MYSMSISHGVKLSTRNLEEWLNRMEYYLAIKSNEEVLKHMDET